jgi:hypothetical protein
VIQAEFPSMENLLGIHIAVKFEIHTAFQFSALTGKFLRIGRNILITCCSVDTELKLVIQPEQQSSATTGSDTADTSGFLTARFVSSQCAP